MENPIKMDGLGYPYFMKSPICLCVSVLSIYNIWFVQLKWIKSNEPKSSQINPSIHPSIYVICVIYVIYVKKSPTSK